MCSVSIQKSQHHAITESRFFLFSSVNVLHAHGVNLGQTACARIRQWGGGGGGSLSLLI